MAYTTEAKIEALLEEDITASTTPTTAQVAVWIDEADAYIDEYSGSLFDTALVSSDIHSYDAKGFIRTDRGPIVSVSELLWNKAGFNATADDWQTLAEGTTSDKDFYLDEYDSKRINFKTSTTGNSPIYGIQNLRVTYIQGYETTPVLVSEVATLLVSQKVIMTKVYNNSFSSQDSISIGPISISKSNVTVGNLTSISDYISERKKLIGTFQVKGRNII